MKGLRQIVKEKTDKKVETKQHMDKLTWKAHKRKMNTSFRYWCLVKFGKEYTGYVETKPNRSAYNSSLKSRQYAK